MDPCGSLVVSSIQQELLIMARAVWCARVTIYHEVASGAQRFRPSHRGNEFRERHAESKFRFIKFIPHLRLISIVWMLRIPNLKIILISFCFNPHVPSISPNAPVPLSPALARCSPDLLGHVRGKHGRSCHWPWTPTGAGVGEGGVGHGEKSISFAIWMMCPKLRFSNQCWPHGVLKSRSLQNMISSSSPVKKWRHIGGSKRNGQSTAVASW